MRNSRLPKGREIWVHRYSASAMKRRRVMRKLESLGKAERVRTEHNGWWYRMLVDSNKAID